jgi:hypothetical protein
MELVIELIKLLVISNILLGFGVKSGFSSSENDSFEILYLLSVDDLALREWGPQFNCGNHTISAAKILSTLPDEFILKHIPCNPMYVFHETIQWIGKDHLSPELENASNFKEASKCFSVNRSPIKGQSQSFLLLRYRNKTNETLMDIKELRSRLNNSEQKMSEYSSKFNRVLMENDILNEQLKLIREENKFSKNISLKKPT